MSFTTLLENIKQGCLFIELILKLSKEFNVTLLLHSIINIWIYRYHGFVVYTYKLSIIIVMKDLKIMVKVFLLFKLTISNIYIYIYIYIYISSVHVFVNKLFAT